MKQTFSVNIGGRAYNIDDDAYQVLDRYLNDISSRLSDSDVDSMDDIERRIADIFDERLSSSMQVVNVEMVRRVIAIIGRPEMFGGHNRRVYRESAFRNEHPRLYRSADNRVLGGVCGGLGDYFDIDPSLFRILTVILFFIPPFPAVLAYIIMWIVIPVRPDYGYTDRYGNRRRW